MSSFQILIATYDFSNITIGTGDVAFGLTFKYVKLLSSYKRRRDSLAFSDQTIGTAQIVKFIIHYP